MKFVKWSVALNGAIHVISNSKKLRQKRVSFASRKDIALKIWKQKKYNQNWHDVQIL